MGRRETSGCGAKLQTDPLPIGRGNSRDVENLQAALHQLVDEWLSWYCHVRFCLPAYQLFKLARGLDKGAINSGMAMFLEITTTHRPATDPGMLSHKGRLATCDTSKTTAS